MSRALLRAAIGPQALWLLALAPAPGASGAGEAAELVDGAALERALSQAQARLEGRTRLLEDHTSWERAWVIPTRDYSVRTSLNWYIGKRLGDNLEAMLDHFRQLGRSQWRPPEPLQVFLFPSLPEYNAFGEQYGAHHSSILGGFWASDHPERPAALYFDPNSLQVSMWATHAAFHQFAEQAFPTIPELWVSEGLASYYAIYYWDPRWGVAEFQRVVESPARYVRLRQLMREPLENYAADPQARFVELATLFHYLLNCRADTRTQKEGEVLLMAPAEDYFHDLLRGRDVTGHPVHELLTSGLEGLEAELCAFDFGV
jgi:hypothetical protein